MKAPVKQLSVVHYQYTVRYLHDLVQFMADQQDCRASGSQALYLFPYELNGPYIDSPGGVFNDQKAVILQKLPSHNQFLDVSS